MLLFHSPAGHWSCFHSSAVTNDAVAACGKVSVCAHVFISRGCELGAGLLGRVVTLVPVVAALRLLTGRAFSPVGVFRLSPPWWCEGVFSCDSSFHFQDGYTYVCIYMYI